MSVMSAGVRAGSTRPGAGRRLRAAVAAVAVFVAAVGAGLLGPPAEAASGFDPHLARAPYLTDLTGLHVNVNWATDQSAPAGALQWGAVVNGACQLTNTQAAIRTTARIGTINRYQWKAPLALPAAGRYCYRPQLAGIDLLGTVPTPQFQSQVPKGDLTPFSFAVLGDWGLVDATGTNPGQSGVISQIAASGVRFAVTVGDNGYPNGSQINYGDLQQRGLNTSAIFGPDFWTKAGPTVPLFTAAGNHGLSGVAHTDLATWTQDTVVAESGGRYVNEVYCCQNGTQPANYGSEWYAFDAGPARFYVLDSAWGDMNVGSANVYANDYAAHFAPGTPQYQWLVNDLAAHPGQMKFAFSHYPFYSDSKSQPSDTYLQGPNKLEGLLARNGVKVVFNGHAHIYQRNVPSGPGMPVTYVTGGGGATLGSIGPCQRIDAYGFGWSNSGGKGNVCGAARPPSSILQAYHFLKVTVAGTSVTVAPTDSTGRTFDVQTY